MAETEEVIKRIVDLYQKHKTPALVILKTSRAGEEVENGYGVDFDLPEYAVIYDDSNEGERSMLDRNHDRYEMERQDFPDIFEFSLTGCPSVEDLIQEMFDRDKYEVIWRAPEKSKKEMNTGLGLQPEGVPVANHLPDSHPN